MSIQNLTSLQLGQDQHADDCELPTAETMTTTLSIAPMSESIYKTSQLSGL